MCLNVLRVYRFNDACIASRVADIERQDALNAVRSYPGDQARIMYAAAYDEPFL